MRLGIIEFGTPLAETPSLLAALRERGIDVITKLEEPPQSARDESERLHRAECDGVLLTLGEDVAPDDVAEAMLHIHCPVVVSGLNPEVESGPDRGTEALALVMQLAVAKDQRSPSMLSTEWLVSWLAENAKSNRQRGLEAAHKLYGVRLFRGKTQDPVDRALSLRWLKQFGVMLREVRDPQDIRPDDITAEDGDVLAALTRRLLEMIAGDEKTVRVDRASLSKGAIPTDSSVSTLCLISTYTTSQTGWNFYGRVVRGALNPDGTYSIGAYPYGFLSADEDDKATSLYAIPGDFVGAVRAALNTLDVPTVVLRDDEPRHRF